MSNEEKLKLCIGFIKKIEKGDIGEPLIINAVDADIIDPESNNSEIIINMPDILRDKAWHLLCDVDGL